MSNRRIIIGDVRENLHWGKMWLEQEYAVCGKSAADIASEQGCSENNILYFLQKHAIPRRTISEARAVKRWGSHGADNPMHGRTGRRNPNWKGGVTPERQSVYSSHEWKAAVSAVWKRDRAECQRCGRAASSSRGSLHVHHIAPFSVAESRCDVGNLALLCHPCHSWVHSRRNVDGVFIK